MSQQDPDADRLICPKCGEMNAPGRAKPLIAVEANGTVAECGVCGTVGLIRAFKPWLPEAPKTGTL